MTRARGILLRLALVAFGVLGALGLVEIGFRVADISPVQRKQAYSFMDTAHPLFGWFYRPNEEFTYDSEGEFSVQVKINAHGLRERETSYQKPNGIRRVLVLGDSFAAGLEVPLENSWHELLERRLRTPSGKVEVISAGVTGWGTDQELLYYRHEGHKYGADLIVLQFFLNDIGDNDNRLMPRGLDQRKPYFVLRGDALDLRNFPYSGLYATGGLGSLRTYRFMKAVVERSREGDPDEGCQVSPTALPRQLFIYALTYDTKFEAAWALTRRLIRELNTEVTRRGARLAVIYFPNRHQVVPEAWGELQHCYPRMAEESWNRDKPNQTLGEFLREQGVPMLDLTPAFRAARQPKGSLYYPKNKHFRPAGHRLAAEQIYDWLVRSGVMPAGGVSGQP